MILEFCFHDGASGLHSTTYKRYVVKSVKRALDWKAQA